MKKYIWLIVMCLLFCGCSQEKTLDFRGMYELQIQQTAPEEMELQKNLIRWFNLNLESNHPDVGFENSHNQIANLIGGMVGYLEIPGDEACIPIFHDFLEGVFVTDCYSPFPTGRPGEQSRLYTDLPLVFSEGDIFRIHILDDVLTYQIGGDGNCFCVLICDGVRYSGACIVEH